MINEVDVFDRVSTEVKREYGEDTFVASERVSSSSSFPAVWVVEIDTYAERNATTLSFSDEQRRSVFEIQTFSNLKSGATAQAKQVMSTCSDAMKKMYYRMTMCNQITNEDSTIKRFVARFERIIGGSDKLPE